MRSFDHGGIRAEALDAEFHRDRAAFCHQLAEASGAARLLSERLHALAKSYEHRALVAKLDRDQAANDEDVMASPLSENALAGSAAILGPTNAT